jgi:hypothetical protein
LQSEPLSQVHDWNNRAAQVDDPLDEFRHPGKRGDAQRTDHLGDRPDVEAELLSADLEGNKLHAVFYGNDLFFSRVSHVLKPAFPRTATSIL